MVVDDVYFCFARVPEMINRISDSTGSFCCTGKICSIRLPRMFEIRGNRGVLSDLAKHLLLRKTLEAMRRSLQPKSEPRSILSHAHDIQERSLDGLKPLERQKAIRHD